MEVQLYEVLDNGEKLSMLDGSIWLVNPGDIPTVCTWIPLNVIEVTKNNIDSMYNYFLDNDGVVVRARKIY